MLTYSAIPCKGISIFRHSVHLFVGFLAGFFGAGASFGGGGTAKMLSIDSSKESGLRLTGLAAPEDLGSSFSFGLVLFILLTSEHYTLDITPHS